MDIENKEFSKAPNLKEKYKIIYDETFSTSYSGTHSTIYHFLKDMPVAKKKGLC